MIPSKTHATERNGSVWHHAFNQLFISYTFSYLFEEAVGFFAQCVDYLSQSTSFGNQQDANSRKFIHFRSVG